MTTIPISKVIADESYKIEIGTFIIQNWLLSVLRWVKKNLNSIMDRYLSAANNSLVVVNQYTPEIALSELRSLQKFLPKIRKYTAKLESVDFFDDPAMGEKAQLTLDRLYELEGELKLIAFSNKKKGKTPSELVNGISDKSKAAISIALDKK